MKINWYTLTYNEEDIVPYVVDYWKKIIKDGIDLHVCVYDNYSTDSTVKLLSKYDWIEIRYFKTDGMNDLIQAQIKNYCWNESRGKADFVCVADFDEILWSNNLMEELQFMKDNGFDVLGTKWYAFCGEEMPTYTEGKYLHQLVKRGYQQYINHMEEYKHLGKFMIIDPNKIKSMNWSVGNHIINPYDPINLYVSEKIIAFHINKGLSEDYFVNKRCRMGKRLSETNKRYGMCIEYLYPEEKTRKEYEENLKKSVDISNI